MANDNKGQFAHLHVHTEYSILDGGGLIEDYVAKAAEDGMPALASTDHGNLHVWPELLKLCDKYGLKAMPGCELYLEPEIMGHERTKIRAMNKEARETGDSESGKQYFHQTTIAINQQGYRNLLGLQTEAWLNNYYYKPMSSLESLERHSEGIVATSSCLGGVPLQYIMKGKRDEAEALIGNMVDIYGKDRYFIEIQNHGIKEQDETNPILMDIAKKMGLKVVATNDCHYTNCSDHKSHDALLCVQTYAKISDKERFRFSGREGAHALLTSEEMYRLFSDYGPEVCRNTLLVAEMTEPMNFGYSGYRMPQFPLPKGHEVQPGETQSQAEERYLKYLVKVGAQKRWGTLTNTQKERLRYEVGVICQMGFAGYFLILWDLCRFARSQGMLVGPGRGSAAGCAVAYVLMITGIDPLEHNLLFERFLNPERISMPDIDLDFETRHRDALKRYTADRYGEDKVAQVVTFGTFKARSAVRDAAKVLGKGYGVGNTITAEMPDALFGRETPLRVCMAEEAPAGWEATWPQAKRLRDLYASDAEVREVIDTALGMEGLVKSTGVHAAALIIGDAPLENYIPLMTPKKSENGSGLPASQWDMGPVEDQGLVKMDYLGLRNLDVITDTFAMLKAKGVDLSIPLIPVDDEATYAMLSQGKGIGVFQLDSPPMRELMGKLKPENLNDIGALVALYRPGPMAMNMHTDYAERKHGRQDVELIHPDAEEILAGTYGLMIYQESMMLIAQKFAGYSLGQADNLRKACGKKIKEKMAEEKKKFIQGCEETGYGKQVALDWWKVIEPFADYAFAKSHAMSYGFIAYITAYLKCHHTAEYFAALLNSVRTNVEKMGGYMVEARAMGVEVRPPHINHSDSLFSVVDGAIYYGLAGIRGLGDSPAEKIVEYRKRHGEYKDFVDFIAKAPKSVKNKARVESLVTAGCFDDMHTRGGLLSCYEAALDSDRYDSKQREAGMISLADSVGNEEIGVFEVPEIKMDRQQRLALEKEYLGTYVSEHPLEGLEDVLSKAGDRSIEDFLSDDRAWEGTLSGLVSSLEERNTKKGDLMAWVTLEDLTGSAKVLIFPRTWTKLKGAMHEGQVVALTGKRKRGESSFFADSVKALNAKRRQAVASERLPAVRLTLGLAKLGDISEEQLVSLRSVLADRKGSHRVVVRGFNDDTIVDLGEKWLITPAPATIMALRKLDFVASVDTNVKGY